MANSVAHKFFDDLSSRISIVVPILLKKFFICLSGGQIGTGPFPNEMGGNGIALTIDMVDESPYRAKLFTLRSFGESLYHSITDASLEFGFKSV